MLKERTHLDVLGDVEEALQCLSRLDLFPKQQGTPRTTLQYPDHRAMHLSSPHEQEARRVTITHLP